MTIQRLEALSVEGFCIFEDHNLKAAPRRAWMVMLYNGFGQLTNLYQEHLGAVVTGTSKDVVYAYGYGTNAAGEAYSRQTSMIYPGGRTITDNYNTADPVLGSLDSSISRLSYLADGTTHLEEYSYLGLGMIVIRNRPQNNTQLTYYLAGGSGDGGDQYVGLDRFGRIIDQNWINGSTELDRFQYGYDQNSNVLYRLNAGPGTGAAANSELYHAGGSGNGYDNLNRLKEFTRGTLNSTHDSITGTASRDQTYTLDAVGNWNTLVTGVNGTPTTQTRSANAQNQYSTISGGGGNTPLYDFNGDTTKDDRGLLYTFDAWNRIVKATGAGFISDTLTYMPGDTASATVTCPSSQTDSYYSMNGQVVEDDSVAPVCGCCQVHTTSTYAWGEDYVNDLIERDTTVGTARVYAQHDANWDITSLVNANATPSVLERFEFDPYGTRTVLAATWGSTSDSQSWIYSFQGGRLDPADGLVHFGARDLSTTLGRWMQEEPTGADYADGANLYQFTGGNPVAFVDPSGEISLANVVQRLVPSWRAGGSHTDTLPLMFLGPGRIMLALTEAGELGECCQGSTVRRFLHASATLELYWDLGYSKNAHAQYDRDKRVPLERYPSYPPHLSTQPPATWNPPSGYRDRNLYGTLASGATPPCHFGWHWEGVTVFVRGSIGAYWGVQGSISTTFSPGDNVSRVLSWDHMSKEFSVARGIYGWSIEVGGGTAVSIDLPAP